MTNPKIIPKEFYIRETVTVAKDLLGKTIARKLNGTVLRGKIVETEAYTEDDPACHAFRGKTKRAAVLFEEPGTAYVYFIYGMYHCLNVVTEPYDQGGAVLIRALEPLGDFNNTHGPGRLCKALQITKDHNRINLTEMNDHLWIEEGAAVSPSKIITTTRIGISQALDFPWRFYIKDNKFVSLKGK